PNNIADAGHKPFYSTLSTWDTFRAAHPLYTILVPEKAAEFVDSMLEQGRRTGYLPIWTLWGRDNQCMIGTHSIPVIVDAYLKGFKGDWPSAYAQIKETLTKRHEGRYKERWDLLDRHGYYPYDVIRNESVSRTLECAYDDWCAAQMAERLGERGTGNGERDESLKADAKYFLKRSGSWRNVFDPSLGLMRSKDSKGNWRDPFDPSAVGYGPGYDFTEGNSYQYTWHVMQNPDGLVAAMGGREAFVKRLDGLFERPEVVKGEVFDVTGLIGQYVHGNEPSHHVIYFYTLVGERDKAARRVRDVFDKFYLPKPDGLCGNDDCGQMSAWYVFSALGFYPFNPCGGTYVLGAPQIPKATIELAGGKTLTVVANNLSVENKYVKSVTFNGKPLDKTIEHADLMSGGELVFEMTNATRR
ncbi:MAG: glycoside hydrolase family 92 protein, partial [Kiritimatiellae bacterium]|nr:glycoside hydrolase family 92 protein [Kiritimatiellia bacterium]